MLLIPVTTTLLRKAHNKKERLRVKGRKCLNLEIILIKILILEAILEIWRFQESFSSISTPRYLT